MIRQSETEAASVSPEPRGVASDTRLSVLLNAYAAERADDTQAVVSIFALLTAVVGLMSVIGWVLINAQKHALPGWIIALAPIPPIPFIAFGTIISHLSNVRGSVIDMYENEIRRIVGHDDRDAFPVPVGHTLLNRIWQGAYGRAITTAIFFPLVAMYLAVIVQSFRYAHRTEPVLAFVSLIGCSLTALIMIGLLSKAYRPQRFVDSYVRELMREQATDDRTRRDD